MRRRAFVAVLGGAAAAWALSARAQQAMPVIGYLGSESPELSQNRLRAFRQGLSRAGFDEGRNVAFEFRWAEGRGERLPALAAELARRPVSVIVTPGSVASALAAKAATSTIPIVFETGADPVASGLVRNLARPGGNITGVTSLNPQFGQKRLELLHELLPAARSFILLVNPANPLLAEINSKEMRAAAQARGLGLHPVNAGAEADLDGAFAACARVGAGGLVVASDPYFNNRGGLLGALALRHRVPAIHQTPEFSRGGGLMSYGSSIAHSHREAGFYAGRILRGEKPGDLPVQQATKVELIVNLKAAAALGVAVPESLLARADELIE